MKSRVLTTVLLLAVFGLALAEEVSVDYDPNYPRDTIKTFAWDASAGEVIKKTSELLHDHMVDTIEQYLDASGYRKVDAAPDVYVTYHTSVDETLKVNTVEYGYFVPTGWYWGPYGGTIATFTGKTTTATNVKSYEKGTLIVDLFDAESKQMICRGAASDIAVDWNPKKIEKRLDKAMAKIVAQWKQIGAGKSETK